MEYNNFAGHLPNFAGNLSTQLNTFSGNQIAGQIPTKLENLVDLISLGMEENHLTKIILASFGKFQKMQTLYMNKNKFLGEILAIISHLSHLFELDVSYNMLTRNITSTIANRKSLECLDTSHNNLSGAIPS